LCIAFNFEKNSSFVERGGEVEIALMHSPWHRIPDSWDHPCPRIQCKVGSREVGKEVTKEDFFEGTCHGIGDFPMSGTKVTYILLTSIYCSYVPKNMMLTMESDVGF
jgi:hypothetical protein